MAKSFGARKDKNHNDITDGLRSCGYYVLDTYRQGDGCPDCFVLSKANQWVGMEIKTRRGSLTPQERALFDLLPDAPIFIVRSLNEALEIISRYD